LDQIRQEATDLERRRDTAKADVQQADSALSAAQKLLQETFVKQGALARESARLEEMIERLKKEKEAMEKALGHLEGQQPKSLTGGQ